MDPNYKKELHFPAYSPNHILHLFLAVVLSIITHLLINRFEPASVFEAYSRSKVFFIVELAIFYFAILVLVDLKVFISNEKYAHRTMEKAFFIKYSRISFESLDNLHEILNQLNIRVKSTITFYRVLRVLDFFQESQKTADTSEYNDKLSVIIKENTETNFEYIRYCIWVIPIVGFIGTIWGIMKSVYGFSSILGQVEPGEESQVLIKSLRDISIDLSTAFETTLPALIISGILALLLAFLDRSTDRLLLKLDKSQIDNIISKLDQPISILNSIYSTMLQKVDHVASDLQLTESQKREIISVLSFLNSVEMERNDLESISQSLEASTNAWNRLSSTLSEFMLMNQTSIELLTNLSNHVSSNNNKIEEIVNILKHAAKEGIPLSLEVIPMIKGSDK